MSTSKKTPKDQSADIHRNEEKYRTIVENAREGILIMQGERRAYYNPRWLELTGYSAEEYENIPFLSLPHPEDATIVVETYKKLINGEAFDPYMEFRIASQLGATKYLGVKISRIDWDGQPAAMILADDITERKQVEEQLRHNEARFKALTENTPDHILMHDSELKYTMVINPQLGLTEKNMLGKTDHDFLPKEEADILVEAKKQVMASGEPMHFETSLTSRTGEPEFFSGTFMPTFDEQSQPNGLIGYFRNITERKLAEDTLRKRENLLRLSVEHMLEAYALHEAIFDENGFMVDYRFLEFNPAAEKITNIAREDIINHTALEIYPHLEEHGLLKRYADVMTSGVPAHIEDFYYEGDNLDKALDISCFRIDDRHFVCVFRDITKGKQAKHEIIKAKEKAEESEKKLSDSLINLELAQTIASIGNWQFDPEVGIPVWSDEIYKIYERDKKLGPPHIDEYKRMYDEEQYKIFIDAFRSATADGLSYDIILKFRSPNDKEKWIRAICQPDTSKKSAKGYFLRGTIQNITEQMQTEQALKKSEKLLKNAVATAKLGHFQINLKTGEGNWSEETFRIFDRDPSEGEPTVDEYRSLVHEDDVENLYQVYNESIKELKPFDLIYRIRRPNGEIRYVHSLWNVEKNPEGDRDMMFGTLQDITERQLVEMELEKHRNHLESLVEQRTNELEAKMKEHKTLFDMMIGREVRMADLKKVIKSLRKQLMDNEITPIANDPMLTDGDEY